MKRRVLLAGLASVIFSVALLYRLDWHAFGQLIERIDPLPVVAGAGCLIAANVLRAERFRLIDSKSGSLRHWWEMTQVYNWMTSTLPAGSGEVATVYLLRRFGSLDWWAGIRLLLIARIMDVWSLALFLVIAAGLDLDILSRRPAIVTVVVSMVLSLVGVALLTPSLQTSTQGLLRKIPWLERRLPFTGPDTAFGSDHVASPLIYSLGMQALSTSSVLLILQGLGTHLTVSQSAFCLGSYLLLRLIPIQGIGGVGTQAAWWTLSLQVAGYQGSNAVSLGILLYAVNYITLSSMGAAAILAMLIGPRHVFRGGHGRSAPSSQCSPSE